jgi:hypothetical protein
MVEFGAEVVGRAGRRSFAGVEVGHEEERSLALGGMGMGTAQDSLEVGRVAVVPAGTDSDLEPIVDIMGSGFGKEAVVDRLVLSMPARVADMDL